MLLFILGCCIVLKFVVQLICAFCPIIRLNNYILRISQFENYDCHLSVLCSNYNYIIPLPALYKFQILCLMYKFFHCKDLLPPAICNCFATNAHIHAIILVLKTTFIYSVWQIDLVQNRWSTLVLNCGSSFLIFIKT